MGAPRCRGDSGREVGGFYLFDGTPSGPEGTPILTGGDQEGAARGIALTAIGDFNGDGIDDFAVSAPLATGKQPEEA